MHLPAILGAWGAPPDRPAWGALVAGAIAIGAGIGMARMARTKASRPPSARAFVGGAALVAALLTLGYVAFYLRGGSRIVDATSYFLQARAIAEGHFAWHVPDPSASFRGRFLFAHDGKIAGIFPPGYPLLLSLGFAVGAPFAVGAGLAAGIVAATYALARELARQAGMDAAAQGVVARTGAALSVVCAALRYHTADTMAHGACALAFALAMLAALRARRGNDELPWFFLLAGGALGFVVSARFASAIALGGVLAWLAYGARRRMTALAACALGALPGVLLLLVAQSASTGHAFGATQSAYYAAADGPPGCFRYGFGAGIGCLVEHGDFVRARASGGYGALAALGVTARRLRMHLEDVANLEPLALLVLVPFFRARGSRARAPLGVRACGALVLALVLAYAPFYFDGDYPGGGARFFADALPVEHALLALGVALVFPAVVRAASAVTIGLACVGFAVHASYDHEQLRARDGGHPMFDHELLAERAIGVAHEDGTPAPPALVFLDTDHGFDLAHDPAAADRTALALARGDRPSGTIFARLRNDDHDRVLYEHLGRPPAWVYKFLPDSPATVAKEAAMHHEVASGKLEPWSPQGAGGRSAETWRFEGEAEWPPLAQSGGAWAEAVWVSDTCASPTGSGRALALHSSGPGTLTIALPVPRAGAWKVTPRLLVAGGLNVTIDVLAPDGAPLASWSSADAPPPPVPSVPPSPAPRACLELPPRTITRPDSRDLRVVLRPSGPDDAAHSVALDRIQLSPGSR